MKFSVTEYIRRIPMKKMFPVLCCIALVFALGCGGGGGGGETGISTPATLNTTITGTMTVPTVYASGITTDITYDNDAALLASFTSSAVCTVNDKQVAYSFSKATPYFYIYEVTPAEKYDVKFTYKNFSLRSIIPHTGAYLNKNVDLNTTAEASLFDEYKFTAAQIKYFQIDQTLKDGLAQKMLTWLQTPTMTFDSFQTALNFELASFTLNVPASTLGSDLTPARDLTGTWQSKISVVNYPVNIMGETFAKVTNNVTLTLKQSGSSITGTYAFHVVKTEWTQGVDVGYTPIDEEISITGKVSSTNFTINSNNGNISGAFTFTSDLMQGTITNLNDGFGFYTDKNAVKLVKQ